MVSAELTPEEIAVELKRQKIIKFGNFVWASGVKAPFKVDLEEVLLFPELISNIVEAYGEIMHLRDFDAISAVPRGAVEIGRRVAQREERPFINLITGERSMAKRGDLTAVIEDVVTTGGSALSRAIEPLQLQGYKVEDVFAFIDHEQGASELLDRGYNVISVIGMSAVIGAWEHAGVITEQELAAITDFRGSQGFGRYTN